MCRTALMSLCLVSGLIQNIYGASSVDWPLREDINKFSVTVQQDRGSEPC